VNSNLNLDGRDFGKLEEATQKGFPPARIPETKEQWLALVALALEVVGVRAAVRLGDPRIWRQAVSELNTLPLAPLNLPLPVWELYLAHPFEAVTLQLDDGQKVEIPDWSDVYYSWHGRHFLAVARDQKLKWFDAASVEGGQCRKSAATQITTLERLQWLRSAKPPITFAVRTRDGWSCLIKDENRFGIDPTASWLVIEPGEKDQMIFVRIADITSVSLPSTSLEEAIQRLQDYRKATPFVAFQIHLLTGGVCAVSRPEDLLVADKHFHVAVRRAGSEVCETVWKIPYHWIDRLEPLPIENESSTEG
jgi:hypothetical protein